MICVIGVESKTVREQKLQKHLCVDGTHWIWTGAGTKLGTKHSGVCVADMVPKCTEYSPFTSQCVACDWFYSLKNMPDTTQTRGYSGWGCHLVAWTFWTFIAFAVLMTGILSIGCCCGWRVCRPESRNRMPSQMNTSREDTSYLER